MQKAYERHQIKQGISYFSEIKNTVQSSQYDQQALNFVWRLSSLILIQHVDEI